MPFSQTFSARLTRPSPGRWAGLALTVLLLVGLALVLGHVVLAPVAGHADCLVCPSAHQVLPAVGVLAVPLIALCAILVVADDLPAFGRRLPHRRGRAPPALSRT